MSVDFTGSVLEVSDGASDWISTGIMRGLAFTGGTPDMISITTAASSISDDERVGLKNTKTLAGSWFLEPDDDFQNEMDVMIDGRLIRNFRLDLADGVTRITFSGYVSVTPMAFPYAGVIALNISFRLTTVMTFTTQS